MNNPYRKNSEAGRIVDKMGQVLGDMTAINHAYAVLSREQLDELKDEMATRLDYFGDFNGFAGKIMDGELDSKNEQINQLLRS